MNATSTNGLQYGVDVTMRLSIMQLCSICGGGDSVTLLSGELAATARRRRALRQRAKAREFLKGIANSDFFGHSIFSKW
jgi:hypothetical protein